jgi:hypothetical protein
VADDARIVATNRAPFMKLTPRVSWPESARLRAPDGHRDRFSGAYGRDAVGTRPMRRGHSGHPNRQPNWSFDRGGGSSEPREFVHEYTALHDDDHGRQSTAPLANTARTGRGPWLILRPRRPSTRRSSGTS